MRKMIVSSIRVWCVALTVIALTISGAAQSRDRAQTPDKYKWNLTELYAERRRVAFGEGETFRGPAEAAAIPGESGLVGHHTR